MREPRWSARRRRMGGAMCVVLLALGGCTLFRGTAPSQSAPTPAEPPPYRIGAGDTLDIIVWHEETVSGTVPVRADGMITVALVGDLPAAGLTPEELATKVREALSRFIDASSVVVRVKETGSRKFFMIGNVKTPGMYDLRADQTLVQALAVAGGFTDFANRGRVKIIRAGAPPKEYDYDDIVRGDAQDVKLEPNDTVVVP